MQSFATHARRYAAAGWRHRWKALALTWLVCLLGWAGVYAIPNQFRASARIYADADAILGTLLRGIAVDSSPAGQVEVLQRTLLSRPNLEKVVARTDLDMRVDSVESRELLLQRLAKEIRIAPQSRNLFTIEYTDSDPRLARDVVQATLNMFLESATGSNRQQMENARTFVAQQIAAYEAQLREAERRRAEFQARYVDLLPSDALGGVSRLETARTRLQEMRGELLDARMRRDLTRRQLEAVPPTLAAESAGGGDGRLAEAERALRELRLRYTDQHPDVAALRSLIAELRANGGGGLPRAPSGPRSGPRANPLHEQLKLRMMDADAQIASLERQVGSGQAEVERLDAMARTMPDLQAQFTNLDRDYTVLRKQYEELLTRREAVQLGDAARTGADRVRLEIIDPPVVPTVPVAPNRVLFTSAALAAGLGAGIALALLLAQLDTTFYTVHDLRRLGLTVLGGVSAPGPSRRIGSAIAFAGALVMLLAAFGAIQAGVPGMLPGMLARMAA